MPTLVEGEAPGGWSNVARQVFAGLSCLCINTTRAPAEVQTILDDAAAYGVMLIVQVEHTDHLAGLVDLVTQFQVQVKYYEIINEPDLSMDVATYLSYLAGAYRDIESINNPKKGMP